MNDILSPSASPEAIAQAWRNERPDLNHDGLAITLRIRSLSMLIDRHISELAEELGLDLKDLMLLFALRRSGKPYCMRPTDVFRLLRVTSGAATYRADRLVEKGVAQRIYDPEDRRSQLIQLSDEGMRLVDVAVTRLADTSLKCLDLLASEPGELDQLSHLLHAVEMGWLQVTPTDSNPLARTEKHRKVDLKEPVGKKAKSSGSSDKKASG